VWECVGYVDIIPRCVRRVSNSFRSPDDLFSLS